MDYKGDGLDQATDSCRGEAATVKINGGSVEGGTKILYLHFFEMQELKNPLNVQFLNSSCCTVVETLSESVNDFEQS
jgi:hypothetical protein